MTSYVVVIPARMGSTRLSRKPLLEIASKPMVIHTWERGCEAAPSENVYVATDSQEIVDVCTEFGAQVVMTPKDCLTGTDRVAAFAQVVPAEVYINLQGDEPIMPAGSIQRVIETSCANPDQIINGWASILEESEYRSRMVSKGRDPRRRAVALYEPFANSGNEVGHIQVFAQADLRLRVSICCT